MNAFGDLDKFIAQFYSDYPSCKDFVSNFFTVSDGRGSYDQAAEGVEEAVEPSSKEEEEQVVEGEGVDVPSTSGFRISNTVDHDIIAAALVDESPGPLHAESPPDRDSLEVISVAAATLSSILVVSLHS